MRKLYVFSDFKYSIFLDPKFLFFCRKFYIYELKFSIFECSIINLLGILTFKKAYFRNFSFDNYNISGTNPYAYCRNFASNILWPTLDYNDSYPLKSAINFYYAKSIHLHLEYLVQRLLFVNLVAPTIEDNCCFVIHCSKNAYELYTKSDFNIVDSRIDIDYKITNLVTKQILRSFGNIASLSHNAFLNFLRTVVKDNNFLDKRSSVHNAVFTYEPNDQKVGCRSINSLSLKFKLSSLDSSNSAFVSIAGSQLDSIHNNYYSMNYFNKYINSFSLRQFYRYWRHFDKATHIYGDGLRFEFKVFLSLLAFEATVSQSLLDCFCNLKSVYLYDDHSLIRGLKLVSLSDKNSNLKFHQIQYSTLSTPNVIMLNLVDYFHFFDSNFINSFVTKFLPKPILIEDQYPFLSSEESIPSDENKHIDSQFLIGYLDESIQFNDKFAGISYESELANFEALAHFVLTNNDFCLCFKPQFHRNSPKEIFRRSSYLNLLIKRNKLIEFYHTPTPGNTRNNLLPSYAFKNVDLCIGSCIGGTAAYECAKSNIRSVLIHANTLDTPFNSYPFTGKVLFTDIHSVIHTLSSFKNKEQFLQSDLGLWF